MQPCPTVSRVGAAIVCGEGVIRRRTPSGPVIVQETRHNALEARSLGPIDRDADGLMFVRRPLRPRRRLRGTYVNLRQIWDSNYGHWLVEGLPRLAVLADHHDVADLEIIVGNYGANLTNMVFAPPGVTLFALTSEAMPDDFFWDLTSHKGGRYVSLHGTAACADPDLDADFRIDIARFEATLRGLL